jgi:DNA invertase Pin-like site-specific DNA recombinase
MSPPNQPARKNYNGPQELDQAVELPYDQGVGLEGVVIIAQFMPHLRKCGVARCGVGRSMKQLIETIEKLRLRGIGFRSLTEALDTTTAQGRLVFHMFGALAEFERSLIRERTQAGLAAARRIGRTGGRPPKLTDEDIEAAKALLANPDIGVTQIAHRLGVSPATLYRYIPAARTANAPDV